MPRHIPAIVDQHAQEVAVLCVVRQGLADAGHVKLRHLRRLDDRLAAHLDGLAVAGTHGAQACDNELAQATAAAVFTATALALEQRDSVRLERMLAIAQTDPGLTTGIAAAFDWSSAKALRGVAVGLLTSTDAFRRRIGISACNSHLVDPGEALSVALTDADSSLRAQALRAAGARGRRDLFYNCVAALHEEEADCRFWAARSSALLGERYASVHVLHDIARLPGEHCGAALDLLLKLGSPEHVVPILRALLVERSDEARTLIKGLGIIGDPQFIPWLIDRTSDLKLARLAGESISTITGLDLAWQDLDRKPPEGIEFGPNDDPEDDDVAMDEDDGLPWPDAVKIQAWWHANAHNFESGQRYFMGQPPSWEHCLAVRKDGYQRQRIAASEWLCLLQPGTPLFPTSAPAWRQQRWLESMHA